MKKTKPTTAFKVGDIVHISTRVEQHNKHSKQVMTFGRIERTLDDQCLISYVQKIDGRWRITVNDVPFQIADLKEYPNKQLTKLIQKDLESETNSDIVGRWLSKIH